MIRAEQIRAIVAVYLARYPEERARVAPLLAALDHAEADLTSRRTVPGHLTCSAVVLDVGGRVLHVAHKALGMWLPPGGHIEPEDLDLVGVARREVAEETGITPAQLRLLDPCPVDIPIAAIPANPANGEPAHEHYDICHAFALTGNPRLVVQEEEVSAVAWLPVERLGPRVAAHVTAVWPAGR